MGGGAGQTDEDIPTGGMRAKPKRIGARTVQTGSAKVLLGGGGGGACIGEEKKRQIFGIERWHLGGMGAGEGALSESAANWRGTALQYPTNAQKLKPKKNKHRDRGPKKWFGEGLVGEIRFFSKKNSRLVED